MSEVFRMTEKELAAIQIMDLPCVEAEKRHKLPNISAVYIITAGEWYSGGVLYVGQSNGLVLRLAQHSVFQQIKSRQNKHPNASNREIPQIYVHYLECPSSWLRAIESRFIFRFRPTFNDDYPSMGPLPSPEIILSPLCQLQARYEALMGEEVNAEHFRKRICRQYLQIDWRDNCEFNAKLLDSYIQLRKLSPSSSIRRYQVEMFQQMVDSIPESGTGEDLRNCIRRIFTPIPGDQTIRRWGKEIKVPFYVNTVYTRDEIERWVIKLLTQNRFRGFEALPKPKKIKQAA